MTEELKQAAQQALEAFESRVTLNSIIKQYRIKTEDAHWLRASLPTQPAAQATPDQFADASKMVAPVALRSVHLTRDTAGMCVVRINGRVAIRDNGDLIDHTATLEWFADTQQATPEPVGEALQFPPMPEGWPARFRCDSCDGNGEIGELVSSGHFQPPERQTCPDCGGRGWTSEEHAFNADHMREFAEAHALLTRPAPGVPEGWTVSAYKAAGLTIQSMAQLKGPDLWKIADAAGNVLNKQGEWEWEPMPSSRDDAFLARCRYATLAEASAALAAAQAKGADK